MLEDIIAHLNSDGYPVTSIVPDGKIHRFNIANDTRRSGFYVCYRNYTQTSGEEFYFVQYGSWREGTENAKSYSTLKGKLSPEDRKHLKAQIAKAEKEAEVVRREGWELAAAECEAKWALLSEVGTSEYLVRKQVVGDGVKYDTFNGDLYVPVRDESGKLHSLQRIDRGGNKSFYPGARVRDCFHVIGGQLSGPTICFAEGYATACSIHLATGWPVVCAFNASALGTVSRKLRDTLTDARFIICGDNDRKEGEENRGQEAARKAAIGCRGEWVTPLEPGDFNDIHCKYGLAVVKEQITNVRNEQSYIVPLGFREREFFFTSSHNRQIVSITTFSKAELLSLMPIEYWEMAYPSGGNSRFDTDSAVSALMDAARKRGIFQNENVRGTGVWEDDGRIVVNMGDHLFVDGRRVGLGEIRSRFFYSLGITLPPLHPNPLTVKECEVITSAAELFRWKRDDFGYLLAGAMVTSRVCGALPVRPHIWLTGSAGQGKSTLFEKFIHPLIGQPLHHFAGSSTEASIRQILACDSVPVLFDEFESTGQRSQERIQAVLDLARVAWSETNASIGKGSPNGRATKYRARFAGIFTSIRQQSLSDADRSRFATIELAPHGNDKAHWAKLSGLLAQLDEEFGRRLFSRCIHHVPTLLANFRTMKTVMGTSQRFSDQYGMLLAGYGILMQDEPLTEKQARILAAHIELEEEKEVSNTTDHDSAFEHLITTPIMVEGNSWRKQVSIASAIEKTWKHPNTSPEEREALLRTGIRVESEFVIVACGEHAELKRVFRGTNWEKAWGPSLRRLPGADAKRVRIGGKIVHGIYIPIKNLNF